MTAGHPPTNAWEPLTVAEVFSVLDGAPFRWWISGGRALALHLGRQWRHHDDTDVGFVRNEADLICTWLTGWELWVASSGKLTPWHGEPLVAKSDQTMCGRDVLRNIIGLSISPWEAVTAPNGFTVETPTSDEIGIRRYL